MQVRLAKFKGDKARAPVAIKEVRDDAAACVTHEALLHSRLSHRRIVPILAVLPSSEDTAVISGLVTPYCEGGSLGEWLDLRRSRITSNRVEVEGDNTPTLPMPQVQKRNLLLSWSQRLRIAEHVLEALSYMHARKVCHLDLKPGNLLMRSCHPDTDADILLCDFGLARYADGSFMPGRYRGTWPYMPPEMVVNNQTRAHAALDIWSLGVVLFDLVSDHPAGHMQSADEIKSALRDHSLYTDLENEAGVHCEPEWLQLLALCLEYNPERRPSAAALLEFVRAQRSLCEHREKMRFMHAAVLRGMATGGASSSSMVASRSSGSLHRGFEVGVDDHDHPGSASQVKCIDGLCLPDELLSSGEATHSRARQLNLPDSLDLNAVAPSPLKLQRASVRNRCAELNLPESLELYTARTSAAEQRAIVWDAESTGASASAAATASDVAGSATHTSVAQASSNASASVAASDVVDTASDPSVAGDTGLDAASSNGSAGASVSDANGDASARVGVSHDVEEVLDPEEEGVSVCACGFSAARHHLVPRDHSFLPDSLGLY